MEIKGEFFFDLIIIFHNCSVAMKSILFHISSPQFSPSYNCNYCISYAICERDKMYVIRYFEVETFFTKYYKKFKELYEDVERR